MNYSNSIPIVKEQKRKSILNGAWQLFKEYLLDTEINTIEDKDTFLKECIDSSKYFYDHAPKILDQLLPLETNSNEPIKTGNYSNSVKSNNRNKRKSKKSNSKKANSIKKNMEKNSK